MGRFSRRHEEQFWVGDLSDQFSMHDLLALVPQDRIPDALSWLYQAIERGRIQPAQSGEAMAYRFNGGRRAGDGERTDRFSSSSRAPQP